MNGLILNGGMSSRMGIDKGTIVYHEKPQREYLFELLKPLCDRVYLSCKTDRGIPLHLNPLRDEFVLNSPLNGILSAIKRDSTRAWLTVPVDMPLINTEVISYLINGRNTNGLATCFFDSDGVNPEPLFCIWEPGSFSALMEYHQNGNISPREFLKQNRVTLLRSPFSDLHLNINTPEELADYKKTRKEV